MSIIKTQGVKISASFPDYNASPCVRVAPFNDLDVVKASPTALDVKGIVKIVVYSVKNKKQDQEDKYDTEYVVGIETIYKLSNDEDSPRVLHGRKTTDPAPTTINVAKNERIIAAFVGIDDLDPKKRIKALRFAKTNSKDGTVSPEGYTASPPAERSFTYSASFGDIVAFQGIKLRGMLGQIISIGFQTRSRVE
ncbi:hypothetical protein OG21DRAFT_1496004 [Imleria badia]|nr:hypothetical protein OG21DRAFT_1496004 [Imleria badia]